MLTPLEEHEALAQAIGIDRLFLKREDLTPTGSFKYRSAVRQVEHVGTCGKKEAVISSSGNAAISLAHEARERGLRLYVLVSPDISPEKLNAVRAYKPIIILSRRAMRLANYMSARYGVPNLRPSVDDQAVKGFVSLGEEIDEQMVLLGGAQQVVSFITSGASLLGMTRGYRSEPKPVFVAVTSDTVGTMGTSRGRRGKVAEVATVEEVSKEDIERAREVLAEHGLGVAPEAVASFAWIMKKKPTGNVVWVVSGRAWSNKDLGGSMSASGAKQSSSKIASSPSVSRKHAYEDTKPVHEAESFEEIDDIYAST